VERLAVFSKRQVITFEDLPREYRSICTDQQAPEVLPLNYEQAKAQFESNYLRGLLAITGDDLKQASSLSGLNLSTLYRRKIKLNE
jgi:DNA-binding NtrC family response regulator